MRQKSLVIGLLVVLAFLVSGFTYAFWASGIAADTANATGTITVGSGDEVAATINVTNQTGGTLVPTGFEDDVTTFDTIVLNFEVDLDSAGLDASGLVSTLTASVVSAVNGTPVSVLSLLDIVITYPDGQSLTSDGDSITVTVTITLPEPANVTEYNLVAGEDIVITFLFSTTAVNS